MNLSTSFYIIILIIFGFVGLGYSCGPHYDPLTNDQIHPDWFAAIFTQPRQNSSKIDYEFRCLGGVVHPRVVLVSASCVLMGFHDVVSVRFYDWYNNRNITKHTEYQERNVSEITNFSELYPGEIGKRDVNLLILSKPIQLKSFIGVKDIGGYIYDPHYWLSMPTIQCKFIETTGDIHNGYDVKFVDVSSMTKPDCCTAHGYTVTKHTPYSPHADKYITVDDQCKLFLFQKQCFQVTGNQEFPHYNPLICPDDKDNPFLYGFFISKKDNFVTTTTFVENEPWLNKQLKKY